MFTRMHCPRQGRAFTLVEILVVVSVIALLISILLPALAGARAQARRAVCLSNLHQFGVALSAYATQFNGVIPGESGTDPGDIGWSWVAAREFQFRPRDTMDVPVDRLEIFHCPEREKHQPLPFIDYVHNTLLPEGPDVNGVWELPSTGEGYKWIKIDRYKRPSSVVFICDAEREDRVEHVFGSGGAHPTVWAARNNWYAQNWSAGHIDVMDVRTGEHLPEGWGFNETDDVGLRRAARKMHLKRYTNAMFFDGHSAGLQLGDRASPKENYMVWLRRFGVLDPEQAADRDHG